MRTSNMTMKIRGM